MVLLTLLLLFFGVLEQCVALTKVGDNIYSFSFTSLPSPADSQPIHSAKKSKRFISSNVAALALRIEQYTHYVTTVTLGAPGKPYTVIVDLESPYSWLTYDRVIAFNPTETFWEPPESQWSTEELRALMCSSTTDPCYHANSTGFTLLQKPSTFLLYYSSDNVLVTGVNIEDTLEFNYVRNLVNFRFGLVLKESIPSGLYPYKGVLGLGPPGTVLSIDKTFNNLVWYDSFQPPSLLEQLVKVKLLQAHAFSLYFDSTGNGTVLLGAVDTAKFEGNLTVVPLISNTNAEKLAGGYQIAVQGVAFNNLTYSYCVKNNFVGVFSTRSTYISLPSPLVYAIVDLLGASAYTDYFTIPCSKVVDSVSLTFLFPSGDTVDIYLPDLIIAELEDICVLGIGVSEDDIIFGQAFMRVVYTVIHLDLNLAGLAQVSNNDSSNLIEISPSEIPHSVSPAYTSPYSSLHHQIISAYTRTASSSQSVETAAPTYPTWIFSSSAIITPSSLPSYSLATDVVSQDSQQSSAHLSTFSRSSLCCVSLICFIVVSFIF
ncbi:aspartic protease Yps1 [Schizosaccharomyces japonicus yFS275]|uniref:Aspartic protease Yps1 n=1 Tax=Schizosaccharomyces japonicus (strain yFS275 / FY16936) TaxID=402676 RepID=B6JWK7_SCHJY|nr:aspartic protease Yps1 [Schizosaccharomyces japonicus yFS275]EEB05758.1 aspartic protease Yps1 [Schizosaccharomyces japonicus yFS275]